MHTQAQARVRGGGVGGMAKGHRRFGGRLAETCLPQGWG